MVEGRDKIASDIARLIGNIPLLSGGNPGVHGVAGIGAGSVLDVLSLELVNEVIRIGDEDAAEMSRRSACEEGILAGTSSGAATWAALYLAARKEKPRQIVSGNSP